MKTNKQTLHDFIFVFLSLVFYIVLSILLCSSLDATVLSLIIVPITVIPWIYGLAAGVISGFLLLIFNVIILGGINNYDSVFMIQIVIGSLTAILGTLVVGFGRLKNQSLQKVRNELFGLKLGIERSPDVFFITDSDGIITYINPAFTENYGYTKGEALGNTPRMLKSGLKDKKFYSDFWGKIKSGERIQTLMINKTKDGKIIDMEASVNPILSQDKKVIGFLAIQRNVTEKLLIESELNKKVEELAKLNSIMVGRELKMAEMKKTLKKYER